MNRRKLQLNDEQDKLSSKSAKNRPTTEGTQDEISMSPTKTLVADKFKIIINETVLEIKERSCRR